MHRKRLTIAEQESSLREVVFTAISHQKAAGFIEIVRLFIGDRSGRAGLIDNHVIN
jgi:hypothetical protein